MKKGNTEMCSLFVLDNFTFVRYEKEKEAESLVRTVTKSPTAIDCAANKVVKGNFAFCLLNAKLWRSSLGTYQVYSTHRPAPKRKSSPAFLRLRDSKGQSPLVALARAKLRKQKSKIRSHKEKQNHKSKHRTHIAKCIAQSRKSKKPHAEKKQ